MQPYCPLCGLTLDTKLFTGGYRKGALFDVAHVSVECPNCQTQVNITQGLKKHQEEISRKQTPFDRVRALHESIDEVERTGIDDDVIEGEIIDVEFDDDPKEIDP